MREYALDLRANENLLSFKNIVSVSHSPDNSGLDTLFPAPPQPPQRWGLFFLARRSFRYAVQLAIQLLAGTHDGAQTIGV